MSETMKWIISGLIVMGIIGVIVLAIIFPFVRIVIGVSAISFGLLGVVYMIRMILFEEDGDDQCL